jgi:Ca-activated chloride channel family protein
MTFMWPEMLWLLFLVPVIVLAYVLLLRRKKKAALRYASLSTIRDAIGAGQRLRRHVPPVLFLVALALMLVAIARPAAIVTLPTQHETVILSMDVSGSMRATDVKPSRIAAAQEAARAFVAEQPKSTRIGVVSFAATASVVQSPTHSREDILAAIDRFQLQRGTAVGSGILVALKMIFPDAEFDLRSFNPRREAAKSAPLDAARPADNAAPKTVPAGSYASAAIILLTDGQTTVGPDPIESARMAADRGVRVYTVGIGTTGGETIGAEGWSMRVRLDEETLKTIANVTRAEYFYAGNATDLQTIYKSLNTKLFFEQRETEVAALFAAAAAVLALVSAMLSMLWFNRIL